MGKHNTELDILAAVRDHGEIGFSNGSQSEASKRLISLYPEDVSRSDGRVSVLVESLVNSEHLLPVNDAKGIRLRLYARGLTPKGEQRLYELEHPVRAWFKQNWFPAIVAGIAIVTSVAGIAVNVVFKILE